MHEIVIGFNSQYERRANLEIDGKSSGRDCAKRLAWSMKKLKSKFLKERGILRLAIPKTISLISLKGKFGVLLRGRNGTP